MSRDGKATQWVKAGATNPDDLSLISGIHGVEEEKQLLHVVL